MKTLLTSLLFFCFLSFSSAQNPPALVVNGIMPNAMSQLITVTTVETNPQTNNTGVSNGVISTFFLNIEDDFSGIIIDYTYCDGTELSSFFPAEIANSDSTLYMWVELDYCGSEIAGCTDPEAVNYNPLATFDDGSCGYEDTECVFNDVTVQIQTEMFGSEVSWQILQDGLAIASDYGYNSYNTYSQNLCLQDGCYQFEMFDSWGDGWNGAVYSISSNGIIVSSGTLSGGDYGVYNFGINIAGCDSVSPVLGCTDPESLNYNPFATVDDGSCEYPCEEELVHFYLCAFFNADELAIEIIGSNNDTIFSQYGFDDMEIVNLDLCLEDSVCYTVNMYNTTSNTGWYNGYFWINNNGNQIITNYLDNNLSSETTNFSLNNICPVIGCTDPEALNYNPLATMDNGSCTYPEPCDLNAVTLLLNTGIWAHEISWTISQGNVLLFGSDEDYISNSNYQIGTCLADGCYSFEMYDEAGDGWNGATYNLIYDGESIIEGTLGSGSFGSVNFEINSDCDFVWVYGCTDPASLNYNPEATIDDGSCIYPIENDLCADATTLLEGGILINNTGALNNEGMDGYCWAYGAGEAEQSSIWYSFTTPEVDAQITIATIGDGSYTLTDTQFGLYLECGGDMIYCDGNSGDGLFSRFDFTCGELLPNTTYLLQIDGYNADQGTCYLSYVAEECAPISGCLDPEALNYNPEATIDDGSCIYPEPCEFNELEVFLITGTWAEEVSWTIRQDSNIVYSSTDTYINNSYYNENICLEDGCYTIDLIDSYGDGWNGAHIELALNGVLLLSEGLPSGSNASHNFAINADCDGEEVIYGCTDPLALNYNPLATVNDDSCIYGSDCGIDFTVIPDTTGLNTIWIIPNFPSIIGLEVFWDFGDGTSSTELFPEHIYEDNGPFNLCLTIFLTTNEGVCENTFCQWIEGDMIQLGDSVGGVQSDGFTINVLDNSGSVGIDDDFNKNKLNVYPNPFREDVQLSVSMDRATEARINITDISGKLLKTEKIRLSSGDNNITLEMGEVENGVYILLLSTEDSSLIKKIIKQ